VAQTSARGVALAALRSWRRKKEFADRVISNALSEVALQPVDRAFTLELFYGVLRNLDLLDFWIGSLRRGHIDVDLRDLLRLGLYQIFIAQTSEHAAVYETVEIAPKKQRAVVNAILRSAARGRQELRERANSEPLQVRASHPTFLIERWKKRFGRDATEALCVWNNQPPPIYARINRLKIDRHTFLERHPFSGGGARPRRLLCSGPEHIDRVRVIAAEGRRENSRRLRRSRRQNCVYRRNDGKPGPNCRM
jgi:16S rRNA (cytosine967-C5)-methyltransferase